MGQYVKVWGQYIKGMGQYVKVRGQYIKGMSQYVNVCTFDYGLLHIW